MPVVAAGTLAIGSRLGKYEILKPLAVGGMAELFIARATGPEGFQKVVVLKRVQPALAENPDFVEMFLDEARLAATLHHPNVAQVHDFGEVDGSYFFTMEYVHGHDLLTITTALEARGEFALPLPVSVGIGLGLMAGLHYAHEKRDHKDRSLNIVHRDVSLGNVLISKDGYVKLVDFGIAKAATRQHQTQVGVVRGKIWYMSPEQTAGKPLDRRSDIYSAGIVLYHLTTGLRPFDGDTPLDIANKIRGGEFVRPTQHNAQYPAALEKIILRALQPNRDKRYQTALELQIDLESFAHAQRLVTSPRSLAEYLETLFGPQDATWVGTMPVDSRTTGQARAADYDSFDDEATGVHEGSAPPAKSAAGPRRVASLPDAAKPAWMKNVSSSEVAAAAATRGQAATQSATHASRPSTTTAAPKETSAGLWPLIALACLGLAVGAYFYGKHENRTQDRAPGTFELIAASDVVLQVATKPTDAIVQLGDKRVRTGKLRVARSKPQLFRVSAPGHVTYETQLELTENTRMVIVLTKENKAPAAEAEGAVVAAKKVERRRKRAERRRRRKKEEAALLDGS